MPEYSISYGLTNINLINAEWVTLFDLLKCNLFKLFQEKSFDHAIVDLDQGTQISRN